MTGTPLAVFPVVGRALTEFGRMAPALAPVSAVVVLVPERLTASPANARPANAPSTFAFFTSLPAAGAGVLYAELVARKEHPPEAELARVFG